MVTFSEPFQNVLKTAALRYGRALVPLKLRHDTCDSCNSTAPCHLNLTVPLTTPQGMVSLVLTTNESITTWSVNIIDYCSILPVIVDPILLIQGQRNAITLASSFRGSLVNLALERSHYVASPSVLEHVTCGECKGPPGQQCHIYIYINGTMPVGLAKLHITTTHGTVSTIVTLAQPPRIEL